MPDTDGTIGTAHAVAHPSLAIAKYWGKADRGINIPATTSVAVTLEALRSRTTVRTRARDAGQRREHDIVTLDGVEQDSRRFRSFFDRIRERMSVSLLFESESLNDFPTAAGLASSASGFAALAAACVGALGGQLDPSALSALARIGSGSAARSVFGGFTRWEAGAEAAVQLQYETWWPDLRVVILPVSGAAKPLSSRDAMNRCRDTSPYFPAWIEDAPGLAAEVEAAVQARDLERMGTAAGQSYLRMFATMFSSIPPIIYWLPESLAIIRELATLRAQGIPAWETMDAGPQVKVFTDRDNAPRIVETFQPILAEPAIVSTVGPGVTVSPR